MVILVDAVASTDRWGNGRTSNCVAFTFCTGTKRQSFAYYETSYRHVQLRNLVARPRRSTA